MNINETKDKIEERFNLKFPDPLQEQLFFEMFNALLQSRITSNTRISRKKRRIKIFSRNLRIRVKREATLFDIEICLAALCVLNWPGKTSQYKKQIEEVKNSYYNNPISRKIILNSLSNSINIKFKNIQKRDNVYFENINDLIKDYRV